MYLESEPQTSSTYAFWLGWKRPSKRLLCSAGGYDGCSPPVRMAEAGKFSPSCGAELMKHSTNAASVWASALTGAIHAANVGTRGLTCPPNGNYYAPGIGQNQRVRLQNIISNSCAASISEAKDTRSVIYSSGRRQCARSC